ncbi:MAG: endonuclease/exonuclease/phosphatase family protein, partial [Nocardioides sp.]
KKRNQGNPPRLDIKQQGKKQCVAAGADTDITVVSYNIKSGHLAGSLSRIAQLLRDSGADVVFMQEVDQRRFASGRVDQPAFFADALDVSYAYGKNAPYPGGGGIGNLILSRFELTEVSNSLLPRPAGTVQRGLQHAVIDVDGTEVSLYNTHLQNANEPARILQVAAINELIADDPRPRVLGGDMNAPPGSAPMNALTTRWSDTWLAAGSGGGRTAPAGAPRARIDYLLHAGEGLTPLAADVLPIRLSDHRAVRAAYALTDPRDPICFQKLG